MKTIVEYDVKGDTSGMIRCYPKNNKLVKFKDIVLDNLESYSDYHKSSYSLWEKYDEFIDNLKSAEKDGHYIFSKPYYIYKGIKLK